MAYGDDIAIFQLVVSIFNGSKRILFSSMMVGNLFRMTSAVRQIVGRQAILSCQINKACFPMMEPDFLPDDGDWNRQEFEVRAK